MSEKKYVIADLSDAALVLECEDCGSAFVLTAGSAQEQTGRANRLATAPCVGCGKPLLGTGDANSLISAHASLLAIRPGKIRVRVPTT